jgi:hypothetical protein
VPDIDLASGPTPGTGHDGPGGDGLWADG